MAVIKKPTRDKAAQERYKFLTSFYLTMVKIWEERITLLGVIDTKALLWSVHGVASKLDKEWKEAEYKWSYLEYGIWNNYGTGREVYRGNPGDIGRDKVREARKWMSVPLYASVMNLKEFMADNIGKEFLGIVSDALDYDKLRYGSQFYRDNPMPGAPSGTSSGGGGYGGSPLQII